MLPHITRVLKTNLRIYKIIIQRIVCIYPMPVPHWRAHLRICPFLHAIFHSTMHTISSPIFYSITCTIKDMFELTMETYFASRYRGDVLKYHPSLANDKESTQLGKGKPHPETLKIVGYPSLTMEL